MSPERELEIRDEQTIARQEFGPDGVDRRIRDLLAALEESRKDAARFIDDGLAIGADVNGRIVVLVPRVDGTSRPLRFSEWCLFLMKYQIRAGECPKIYVDCAMQALKSRGDAPEGKA